MKTEKKNRQESYSPYEIEELDVLRHWTVPAIDFSKYPLSNKVAGRIEFETSQLIESHYEQSRLMNRDVSEAEVEQIQHQVREKHQSQYTDGIIRHTLWRESERILRILRTKGLGPELDESTLRQFQFEYIQKLNLGLFPEARKGNVLYMGADPSADKWFTPANFPDQKLPCQGIGPNDYFAATCPELVADFGYPFHISVYERVLGINTDFFAAYLGGQKRFNHQVVYYEPEERFYFFDPAVRQFTPTSEKKLRILLSVILQERAWGLGLNLANAILNEYRKPGVMDEILGKAKALLAAGRGFFDDPVTHPRFVEEEYEMENLQLTIRLFLETKIYSDNTGILTITDFMNGLKHYLQEKGTSTPRQEELKTIVQAKMREIHGKGVRHDLILEDGGLTKGWKGLRLRNQTQPDVVSVKELSEMQESGPSDVSAVEIEPAILLNQEDIPANPERN